MTGPAHEASLRTGFVAGYAPQVAGLYFNGLELLAEAARGADVPLGAQVGGERERVVGQREAALGRLDEVAELAAALGAAAVPRPEDAGAYSAWAEEVFDAVRETMAGDSPMAVVHLLGFVMGEAVATLDLLAILSRLREVAPDHLWMRWQAESLEGERKTAERRLGRLAAHPALPEPGQVASALAAHAVTGGAPSGSHAGRAARCEAAAREVEQHADTAAAALAP
ncbi:MAG: hypothetical protein LC733_10060 [Actinobacteria bacterium]|nr:hypothetical protein [Actinomycetota bacterium]